jgi:hypothetical protein
VEKISSGDSMNESDHMPSGGPEQDAEEDVMEGEERLDVTNVEIQ